MYIHANWGCDCCLLPSDTFFSFLAVTFWWDADEVCFVLDQHPQLDFNSASSLKQQSIGRHVAPLGINHNYVKNKKYLLNAKTLKDANLQPWGFVLLNVTSKGKFHTNCCLSSLLFFVICVIPSSKPYNGQVV
jgi:hypothetical protein